MLTDNLSWKNMFLSSDKLPSVTEETEPVLKINTNLLKHEEVTKYKNRLIEDSKNMLKFNFLSISNLYSL
jgi:hypothetical protein